MKSYPQVLGQVDKASAEAADALITLSQAGLSQAFLSPKACRPREQACAGAGEGQDQLSWLSDSVVMHYLVSVLFCVEALETAG